MRAISIKRGVKQDKYTVTGAVEQDIGRRALRITGNYDNVRKRHARKLYGGRILTFQLPDLLVEWMARANMPELFQSPLTFPRVMAAPC